MKKSIETQQMKLTEDQLEKIESVINSHRDMFVGISWSHPIFIDGACLSSNIKVRNYIQKRRHSDRVDALKKMNDIEHRALIAMERSSLAIKAFKRQDIIAGFLWLKRAYRIERKVLNPSMTSVYGSAMLRILEIISKLNPLDLETL